MTTKDDIVRVHGEHPDWTARLIADHLQIERYHVYNTARAEGLKLAVAPLGEPGKGLPAVVPTATAAADFTVFANNPADMIAAQHSMIEWCDGKIGATKAELEDAQRNAGAAAAAEWNGGWEKQAKLLTKKIEFYDKVKIALSEGYYIVPPFPIDLFAIRTARKTPDKKCTTSHWDTHEQKAQVLQAGEGRYVSNLPEIFQREVDGPAKDGKPTTVTKYFAENFNKVDFPFALARAEIMQATQAAMALRVFDQMGSLPARRAPDPIICGQILMPHRGRQPLTFFVSWWLDTRTL